MKTTPAMREALIVLRAAADGRAGSVSTGDATFDQRAVVFPDADGRFRSIDGRTAAALHRRGWSTWVRHPDYEHTFNAAITDEGRKALEELDG